MFSDLLKMPKYKLTYFSARARAEISRLLFAAAGVEFEDVRIELKDWLEIKSTTPLGQIPILEIDGVEYPQSMAHHRYLASMFGFMGSNALENLQCDVIGDTCNDLRIPYFRDIIVNHFITKDVRKEEEARQKLLDEALPKFLPIFDKFLSDYGGESGYFVGSKLTWADFAVHEILEFPLDLFPNVLKIYPKLAKHRKMVESNPKIKNYLEKRPKTFD